VSGGPTKPVTLNTTGVTSQGSTYGWSVDGKEEYRSWWRKRHASLGKDLEAGADDAVERAANASSWIWDDGSRPFHWRWPTWYMKTIRDGLEVYFQSENPRTASHKEIGLIVPLGNKCGKNWTRLESVGILARHL
jgi:hypothetical protein